MNIEIESVEVKRFSSKYGNNNAFGQPLGVKSIVILSLKEKEGVIRSCELYAGIYIPELLPKVINYIAKSYIGKIISQEEIFTPISIPFVSNCGIFKSVIGAFQSCIIQLFFHKNNISLVTGLSRQLKNPSKANNLLYYASGGSVSFTPNECKKDISNMPKDYFDGFKMRCGLQSFNKDIERIKAVREEIDLDLKKGKNISLMIDFIQGTLKKKLKPFELKNYVEEIKKYNVLWYEEPLDPDNFSLYKDFSNYFKINASFALGESFTSLNEYCLYERFIKYFQIDITHCGGFSEAINILNYFSSSKNLRFTSHIWGSSLAGLLNLALARASDLITWFEVPMLEFEINKHLFNNEEINYKSLSNSDIDRLLSKINLNNCEKYEFIYGSGYQI